MVFCWGQIRNPKYIAISRQENIPITCTIAAEIDSCFHLEDWSWSYDSWIYNYLCNQCLSSLMLWVWIPLRQVVLDTTLCDKVCQLLATGWWFSPGTPVSSTNKTDRHDITEILFKVALNTMILDFSWCIWDQVILIRNIKWIALCFVN